MATECGGCGGCGCRGCRGCCGCFLTHLEQMRMSTLSKTRARLATNYAKAQQSWRRGSVRCLNTPSANPLLIRPTFPVSMQLKPPPLAHARLPNQMTIAFTKDWLPEKVHALFQKPPAPETLQLSGNPMTSSTATQPTSHHQHQASQQHGQAAPSSTLASSGRQTQSINLRDHSNISI